MSLLTAEELAKLTGAETLFPSPIPVYGVSAAKRAALAEDKVARCKEIYDRHGGERTNLAYGYILRNR